MVANVTLLTGLSGCSYVLYPCADDYAEKAKGSSRLETVLNLITMMEESVEVSKGATGNDQALDDLRNQFHAFGHSLCWIEEAKRETPTDALAVTHHKEL